MFNSKGDPIAIQTDTDYRDAQIALSRRSYPEKLLRRLMQALENYRGNRKIGWSRSWNKVGVRNFQSFKLGSVDSDLQRRACTLLDLECPAIPPDACSFLEELLYRNTPSMGFVFLTEVEDGGERFEGAVLSYGRINAENRRFRDRIDILLESKIVDGISRGLSRVRIFVDPHRQGVMEPLWSVTIDEPKSSAAAELFDYIADLAHEWSSDSSRVWNHWVMEYIDYFGPRRWALEASCFEKGRAASESSSKAA